MKKIPEEELRLVLNLVGEDIFADLMRGRFQAKIIKCLLCTNDLVFQENKLSPISEDCSHLNSKDVDKLFEIEDVYIDDEDTEDMEKFCKVSLMLETRSLGMSERNEQQWFLEEIEVYSK